MIELFWCCLIGGIVFAILILISGGLHHVHAFHHALRFRAFRFLHPTTIVGAITAFGGAGVLLERHTVLQEPLLTAVAAGSALAVSVGVHFGYVRPMDRAETSMAFSVRDYIGHTGEVTIAIRAGEHGEVMVHMGSMNYYVVARCSEGRDIGRGQKVVVVDVQDGVLSVTPLDIE
ncbi:MAG: protease [Bacteroidetes bacterium]|nr:protease [Bacteroidota bacterium]